jgi:hypothetical protein
MAGIFGCEEAEKDADGAILVLGEGVGVVEAEEEDMEGQHFVFER